MQILNVGQRLLEIVLLLINTFICYVRRVSNPVLVIVDWEGRPIARYRLDEKIFFFL